MYGFEPSDEQRMLVDAVQRYAVNDLRPAAHDADEAGELPPALIRKGWELGFLQASVPEAYGGFGERSAVTGVLAAEEMAYGDMAAAMAVMLPACYCLPILLAGTEDQKKDLIPPVIEGDWRPFTAAFVEPSFDFCPAEMNTAAIWETGGYVLKGEKAYVPYADKAAGFLVHASLEGRPQAFVVPAGMQGITVGERERLCGIRALPTFRVKLDDVRVPASARLGGEAGHDPGILLAATKVAIAAMAVGIGRAAYEYARDYAKDRVAFGGPIAQKQSIAFTLAEMAIEVESIRLLVWEAAWMLDAGKDATKAADLALVGSSDAAMMVTDKAVQILGGHGYIREHPVERWMRDGRGVPAFAGLAMV